MLQERQKIRKLLEKKKEDVWNENKIIEYDFHFTVKDWEEFWKRVDKE